jgi:hypothetical protein
MFTTEDLQLIAQAAIAAGAIIQTFPAATKFCDLDKSGPKTPVQHRRIKFSFGRHGWRRHYLAPNTPDLRALNDPASRAPKHPPKHHPKQRRRAGRPPRAR